MQMRRQFQLIDFGGGARLERFADRTVDRPHPAALGARRDAEAWLRADLRFDRDRGWTGPAANAGSWPVAFEGLSMELRPTEAGQLGVFPEHLAMLPWLRTRVTEPAAASGGTEPPAPAILHLFAYTGLATLAMAAAGAAVTHVDSARPTVAWARRNAERSDLDDRPIRWIVDDAPAFTQREARRGRRYAGVVLDPPSYGHGPAGRPWRLEDDLGALLDTCARVLEPGGFVLLTAHTPSFDGDRLASNLAGALARPAGAFERGELAISTEDGRRLELGAFARWPAGRSGA
jgi:23S rRNA (cytosine1962-C5)-methyltransferase